MFACFECEHYIDILLKFSLKIQVWNILQCCIIALKELQKCKVQYLHKGHKYPHLKHKMPVDFFEWFVQYPNVGHKICMFNEKNDDDRKKLNLEKKTKCDK